jgi:hypothetical protein
VYMSNVIEFIEFVRFFTFWITIHLRLHVKHKFSALRKHKPFAELSTTHAKLNARIR